MRRTEEPRVMLNLNINLKAVFHLTVASSGLLLLFETSRHLRNICKDGFDKVLLNIQAKV